MRAIELSDYGPVENFHLVDAPEPSAGPGEIRIKVAYAGLRWGDIMQRNGKPAKDTPVPFIAGQEVAGHIDQIGDGVTGFEIGQPVFGGVRSGGFAEYVVAPVATTMIVPLPESVALDGALAYPLNMITAHLAVHVWGQVAEGQTVLVHAAAGGIGQLIIQIIKKDFQNVRIIGICSSRSKTELLERLGCDHIIDRKTQDYVEEINRICGPKATGFTTGGQQGGGVDVSFNGVAGDTLPKDEQVIRKRGRWVIFGYAGDSRPTPIDVEPIGYDGITTLFASQIAWWGTPEYDAAVAYTRNWLANEPLIETQHWPLEKVAEAQRAMEEGQTTGKVVFDINAS